jgi:hypothetical protein
MSGKREKSKDSGGGGGAGGSSGGGGSSKGAAAAAGVSPLALGHRRSGSKTTFRDWVETTKTRLSIYTLTYDMDGWERFPICTSAPSSARLLASALSLSPAILLSCFVFFVYRIIKRNSEFFYSIYSIAPEMCRWLAWWTCAVVALCVHADFLMFVLLVVLVYGMISSGIFLKQITVG